MGNNLRVSSEKGELHLAICRRFGETVRAADGRWDLASPCDGWNARDVLEHVIGFHDVLLLRPLGLKPRRPQDDLIRRWLITVDSVQQAFSREGIFEKAVAVPAIGENAPSQIDAKKLVSRLTQDVLVHTWDLARAVGADERLDGQWCAVFLGLLPTDQEALSATGMFKPPVAIVGNDPQSQLLGRLGRDPSWKPPS